MQTHIKLKAFNRRTALSAPRNCQFEILSEPPANNNTFQYNFNIKESLYDGLQHMLSLVIPVKTPNPDFDFYTVILLFTF